MRDHGAHRSPSSASSRPAGWRDFWPPSTGRGLPAPVCAQGILCDLSADRIPQRAHRQAHVDGPDPHNVAQVLDLATNRGRNFLAMELVAGWTSTISCAAAPRRLSSLSAWALLRRRCLPRALLRALAHAATASRWATSPGHQPHKSSHEHGEVKLTDFASPSAHQARQYGDRRGTGQELVHGALQAFGSPLDAGRTCSRWSSRLRRGHRRPALRRPTRRSRRAARARQPLHAAGRCDGPAGPAVQDNERALRRIPRTASNRRPDARGASGPATLPPSGATELKRWCGALGQGRQGAPSGERRAAGRG
jgi:hypothetical protein